MLLFRSYTNQAHANVNDHHGLFQGYKISPQELQQVLLRALGQTLGVHGIKKLVVIGQQIAAGAPLPESNLPPSGLAPSQIAQISRQQQAQPAQQQSQSQSPLNPPTSNQPGGEQPASGPQGRPTGTFGEY